MTYLYDLTQADVRQVLTKHPSDLACTRSSSFILARPQVDLTNCQYSLSFCWLKHCVCHLMYSVCQSHCCLHCGHAAMLELATKLLFLSSFFFSFFYFPSKITHTYYNLQLYIISPYRDEIISSHCQVYKTLLFSVN